MQMITQCGHFIEPNKIIRGLIFYQQFIRVNYTNADREIQANFTLQNYQCFVIPIFSDWMLQNHQTMFKEITPLIYLLPIGFESLHTGFHIVK